MVLNVLASASEVKHNTPPVNGLSLNSLAAFCSKKTLGALALATSSSFMAISISWVARFAV